MKRETRILGIDDSPFSKKDEECLIIGVITRGKSYPDAVLSSKVIIDGDDATDKIISMIKESVHNEQTRIIMTDGICLGGFNIINIKKINKELSRPVIAITRNKPHIKKMISIMKRKKWNKKLRILKKYECPEKMSVKDGFVYFQKSGINKNDCMNIIKKSINTGYLPECIRLAHIIGAGVVKGESRGGA